MPYKRSKKATETKNIRISEKAYKKLKKLSYEREVTLLALIELLVGDL